MLRGWTSCARPATSASNSARRSSPSILTLNAARARMPWRSALRLDAALPFGVRGPVERCALARLAAALRSLTGGFEVELDGEVPLFFIRLCVLMMARLADTHARMHRELGRDA